MADRFHLLAYGLAAVLIFIGIKMLIDGLLEDPGGAGLARWRLGGKHPTGPNPL
jgi:hypothetical protein